MELRGPFLCLTIPENLSQCQCFRSLSDLVALNIGQIGENLALGSATIVKAGEGEAICGLCHPRFFPSQSECKHFPSIAI